MELNVPSDEVNALMENTRIRQQAKLRAHEEHRLREEAARIKQEEEDKKPSKFLIETEANMRIDIENYDETDIQHIKNTIKSYPNMHIIELRDMISCHNKNDYNCSSSDCGVCSMCIYRLCIWKHYSHDPVLLKRQKSIQNKRKEIFYEYIDQCVKEIQEEIASENEILRLEALDKLREDIAKANKALPSNKLNGVIFEENRLEIEYIISLDNPNPGVDTRSSGLYFETRHLRAWDNEQLQNRENPQLKEIPVTWNNDYKDNKIPFLPQCPVCSKQNTILFKWVGGEYGSPRVYTRAIDTIEGCHYKWDSNTGKHYNCSKEWDPSDPDGSSVRAEKRKKEKEEIQQQILELQLRLADEHIY